MYYEYSRRCEELRGTKNADDPILEIMGNSVQGVGVGVPEDNHVEG